MSFPPFSKKPEFGKTKDRFERPGQPDHLVERHFHKGEEVLAVHSEEESIPVEDDDVAGIVQRSLTVLVPGKVSKVSLEVIAHPQTGKVQRIVRRYEIGRIRREGRSTQS